MGDSFTLKQVIEITKERLENIEVPVKFRAISEGIAGAVGNLAAVIEAMDRADREQAEQGEKHEDDNHEEGDI